MRILVSNDDGYLAPGLSYLVEALSEIAEVIVVAPDRNRSGASNSLTLDRPLKVQEVKKNYYYVNGTPTDCVHLALTGLLHKLPDMVISGINEGPNLGDDVLYSGTVAAAIEGRYLGLPAMAISLNGNSEHYQTAAYVAQRLAAGTNNQSVPCNTILNVNVPDVPISQLGQFEVTCLGKRHAAQASIKQKDPRGRAVYWMGLPGAEADAGPGTDFHAIRDGHVSITPIELDWTNYAIFEKLTAWIEGI